jgi:glutathione S-transferase
MERAMHKLRLTYFDVNGARGETARLAMTIGQVPFEDRRLSFEQFRALKPELPFGKVPVLEIDGQVVAQSNGINRFVGKLAGLYPEDALQALYCDEAMDAVEDISVKVAPTLFMKDEAEKKRLREELADGAISFYLKALANRLEARGGMWFADGRLTVADLKVFVWLRHIIRGGLDHVPADLPARVAPALVAHFERVRSQPAIQAYYQARGVS